MPSTAQVPPKRSFRRFPGLALLDALAGPHGVDGYLEQINPLWARQECRAEVTAAARTSEDSVTLALHANRAWRGFRAGQFVQVGVEVDGSRRTRCYSPASAAGMGHDFELTIRRHPEGLVSNFLFERARPGMTVALSQAEGSFQLPDRRPGRVLLVSAGSGITPVMSMLRTLCAERHNGPVTFLHYSPDPARMAYLDELDEIAARHRNVRVVRSFTRAPGRGEEDGHFSWAQLARVEPDFAEAETFACGPSGLQDALAKAWGKRLGHRLHMESFVPPRLAAPSGTATGSIHFAGSGVSIDNTGASLLEQAEAAGLQPQFGCRMGICHTCSCSKAAGTVRNLLTGELSSDEEEQVQLCISAPVGDVVLDL
jgi:ferredoxin-NADP reductase